MHDCITMYDQQSFKLRCVLVYHVVRLSTPSVVTASVMKRCMVPPEANPSKSRQEQFLARGR